MKMEIKIPISHSAHFEPPPPQHRNRCTIFEKNHKYFQVIFTTKKKVLRIAQFVEKCENMCTDFDGGGRSQKCAE